MKLLSDDPAPLSSALGMKTLSQNPTPLSSALGMQVLTDPADPSGRAVAPRHEDPSTPAPHGPAVRGFFAADVSTLIDILV